MELSNILFQMHLVSSVSNTRPYNYKTFLEPLSPPNITWLGKKKITEYLFNCLIQGYDESLL